MQKVLTPGSCETIPLVEQLKIYNSFYTNAVTKEAKLETSRVLCFDEKLFLNKIPGINPFWD